MTFAKTLPLRKLQEKGVLENDKLIVEVYINVVEAVDEEGEGEEDVSKMVDTKTVEINGFRVLASQSTSLLKLFAEHPDIAKDFKPKNQVVKTEYMNVLFNIIETLEKPSKNQSNNELGKASSDLSELMELGFKLDWLRSKLEKVSLERKKADDSDGSRIFQQVKEYFKNHDLMDLGSLKLKLEELSLEMKKVEADRSRVQQLEESSKNLEQMELRSVKESVLDLSLKLKKAEDDDQSRVQEFEERVENLEKIVSDLKVELDKEKNGFWVVDDVA